ncbi:MULTISPECIES: VOC family protein [Brevundimonas]|uniref:VOC family protein n=1 Tax=Brevundimonas TaxID=41275 RepID=UPI001F229652|nr:MULTISPECIES: VOC family protein [Brevundimonas]
MSDDIVLNVADPDASARFYAGLLGRRPVEAGPDHAVFLLAPGRRLSLWRGRGGTQADLRMEAPGVVDELHIDWWDRGARIVLPPTDMDGGHGFVARDPDGNCLRVYAARQNRHPRACSEGPWRTCA